MSTRRDSFNQTVTALRPELYRYCARMTGSLLDAEDVLQETLTQAYLAWPEQPLSQPRAWLFRIAHNRAIDFLRRLAKQSSRQRPLIEAEPIAAEDPGCRIEAQEVATMALSAFLYLTPLQRSCVILKDVSGLSLEAIAASLDISVGAVKSALFRGRRQLRKLAAALARQQSPLQLDEPERRLLEQYVAHFNARDFEALRAQLLQEVSLELVDFTRFEGARDVGQYFTRYAAFSDWSLSLIQIEGAPVIQASIRGEAPRAYLIHIQWQGEKIARIRDYRHARQSVSPL